MLPQAYSTYAGKIDFFAIIPAGIWAVIALSLVLQPATPEVGRLSLLTVVPQLYRDHTGDPFFYVLFLSASFLIGSLLRTFPVRYAERLTSPRGEDFPYPSEVRRVVSELRASRRAVPCLPAQLPGADVTVTPVIFNYWKDAVCSQNPSGFAYYEGYEARARLFGSLTWAGVLGVACGVAAAIRFDQIWGFPLGLVGVSLLGMVVFSRGLRRVRSTEVRIILLMYLWGLGQQEARGA